MDRRMMAAWLLAPPVVVLVVWAALAAWTVHDLGPLPHGAAGFSVFFFAMFGLPVAYGAAATLAWPLYTVLRDRRELRVWPVVGAAAVLGALVVPSAMALFLGPVAVSEVPLMLGVGTGAGSLGGAVFWVVGLARRPTQPAA